MAGAADEFRAKLERYVRTAPPAAPPDGGGAIDASAVGAEQKVGAHGRFWRRRTVYNPIEPWGATLPEDDCTRALARGLRVPFAGTDARVSLRRCLFVDCETTGLSGGAGTIPFLTAVGQYRHGAFVVDQYFLPEPADELAVLDVLAERFARAEALVTYNGSSFDLPLLEGRFHFWRLDPAFRSLPHHDLLWATRAVFRRRIGDCSLGNVEERLLRFARVEDLPGAEIPEVYFRYLREGQSPRLHAVFEHNRCDVVSLFVYAVWLDARTDPEASSLADPDDLWSLASYWHRRRLTAPALGALAVAEERVLDRTQRVRIAELRACILKRAQAFDEAHREWETVARGVKGRPDVSEELAKHLEHRRKDYAAALRVVDDALAGLRFREMVGSGDGEEIRRGLLHRRARLTRKLANTQRSAPCR
ncbi:MAG TPA: ribonuclease H-like domain-containing protein [Acidobacteriota bacterium]|nr:ribonuclease H-like domain-containing protein [Acidobacteriota bacterium]